MIVPRTQPKRSAVAVAVAVADGDHSGHGHGHVYGHDLLRVLRGLGALTAAARVIGMIVAIREGLR